MGWGEALLHSITSGYGNIACMPSCCCVRSRACLLAEYLLKQREPICSHLMHALCQAERVQRVLVQCGAVP